MVTTGEGSDTFIWGAPSEDNQANQLQFEGLDFEASTELPFTVGRVQYFNGSVSLPHQSQIVSIFWLPLTFLI